MDLDIAGPQNSVRQDFIELEQRAFPWSLPGENGPNSSAVTLQKRLRAVMPETEEAASIGYDSRAPAQVSIVNERSANKWGTPQGYRIQVPLLFILLIHCLCNWLSKSAEDGKRRTCHNRFQGL